MLQLKIKVFIKRKIIIRRYGSKQIKKQKIIDGNRLNLKKI